MKKQGVKKIAKDTWDDKETGVLLEDINGKFDFIVKTTTELLSMKPVVQKLAEDMEIVKTDIEIIKGLLKRKVDMEEFEALTKRVAYLERKAFVSA